MKWYNIAEKKNKLKAINIIIGGRGIGKTYSTIDFLLNENKPFIYMRNTDIQLDESSSGFGNPFKRWNLDHDRNVQIVKEKRHSNIIEVGSDGAANIIGRGCALSTFENMRGVDLSEIEYVLFDEFIEKRKLAFKQFEAFVNFYETVNRNRELIGEEPLKCILLSNAQKLDNPILLGYNLIPVIERMIRNGQKEYSNQNLYIHLPESEVSEAKKQTANYQLINGSKIADEALNNKFAFDSFYGIIKRPLVEYKAICCIDDIYIYKHKSNNKLYACSSVASNIPEFTSRDNKTIFLRSYGQLLASAAAKGGLEYSDFVIKSKLFDIIM